MTSEPLLEKVEYREALNAATPLFSPEAVLMSADECERAGSLSDWKLPVAMYT